MPPADDDRRRRPTEPRSLLSPRSTIRRAAGRSRDVGVDLGLRPDTLSSREGRLRQRHLDSAGDRPVRQRALGMMHRPTSGLRQARRRRGRFGLSDEGPAQAQGLGASRQREPQRSTGRLSRLAFAGGGLAGPGRPSLTETQRLDFQLRWSVGPVRRSVRPRDLPHGDGDRRSISLPGGTGRRSEGRISRSTGVRRLGDEQLAGRRHLLRRPSGRFRPLRRPGRGGLLRLATPMRAPASAQGL